MAILQLHSTSKSFGKKVILNKVSLSIHTEEIIGLFGRNGSGKSTLLQIIFGTLKVDNSFRNEWPDDKSKKSN